MTVARRRGYDRIVAAVRDAPWRAAVGLALLIGFLSPAAASAATSSFAIGDQAVVQVIAGNLSTVSIRGWDRPGVQLDTDDETVQVNRNTRTFGVPQNPLSVSIPIASFVTRDPLTGATGTATLAPEEFPYASDFRAGPHDNIRIVVAARSHVTVMVPAATAILNAWIRGAGIMTIDNYHGGTLLSISTGGHTTLTDVTSAAFVQQMNGRLDVHDSSFDRLRARGNSASFTFEHTRARQIEVTTISGPIIYDNGTFDPGLARFESTSGAIAVGVASGAQVEARSNDGHVATMFDRRTPMNQRSDSEASATIGGGGPVVNAVTGHGNVFLYDGSLATRRDLPQEWRTIKQTIRGRDPLAAPGAFQRFRELRGRTIEHVLPDRDDGGERKLEIVLRGAMVHHVHADRELAVDARGRRHRDAALLQLDHDASRERIERRVVERRDVAEAHDVERHRREQFERR
jgi:hypothetical protein